MHKKKFLFYFVYIFVIIIFGILVFFSLIEFKKSICSYRFIENLSELNLTSPFSINKIVYFSSANSESEINSNSTFTINNLYQFTDIAIFINNNADDEFNAKNTLKNVKLSDFNYELSPNLGTPNIFYKNINDFAKSNFDENNKIENELIFDVSSDEQIDFSKPILFNNTANPITLCYVNSGLKSDYTLPENISNISYDGSLLKKCNITLNSIACKISFVITIVNNLDETFRCPVILNMPLSTESSTVYDGSLVLNQQTDYKFL